MAKQKPGKDAQPPVAATSGSGRVDRPKPVHGSSRTPTLLYGEAHLRHVLEQSDGVPIGQVCEEAALRLTEFFSQAQSVPQTSDDAV